MTTSTVRLTRAPAGVTAARSGREREHARGQQDERHADQARVPRPSDVDGSARDGSLGTLEVPRAGERGVPVDDRAQRVLGRACLL